MAVEEPGQQRESAEVEHRPRAGLPIGHDGRDAALLDHDGTVAQRRSAGAVDERGAAENEPRGQMRPFRYERFAAILPSRRARMSQPSTS
jgi:hypothetical protein